ncbi:TonB-dependent receptor [uncultured Chryseobacterium sp.]|uniref:TonB-dependent siderophore receptor n=1 Tax=uncultured Chryseobacterium sp. TaxID=259322 RepID=UPI0025FEA3ED|nr:TonB-dependent receptor [uncultured Chryseobacterium sp.]
MKKVLVSVIILGSVTVAAQTKDSANTKNIEEVVINSVTKKDSDYSNKMPLKAIEDPQVYSSVSRAVLENQVLFKVDDAYRNVTGLQPMWTATSRAGDGGSYIVLRGFPSNNSVRNGLVSPVTTVIDAINIERFEVLKGPSGTLYGSNVASYGGLVNRTTKKPSDTFEGQVSLFGGSYNTYRAQADVNAPLTNDKKLLFRINTAYTNEGTFQKKDAQNSFFAFTPTLTYNATDWLQFNLEYEFFQSRAIGDSFFFYLSPDTLGGINNMKDLEKAGLDYKQSYSGKGLYTTARNSNIFGQVNYQINDNIRSSTNINNSYGFSNGNNPYFTVLQNEANALVVGRADQATNNSTKSYFQIQQNFNFDYKFANGMRNRTVIGFDFLRTTTRLHYYGLNSEKYPMGFFDFVPVKGTDYSNFNANVLGAIYSDPANVSSTNNIGDLKTYSGYLSNVFTPLEGLNLVVGLRYENNDFLGGRIYVNDSAPYKQSAWSPKAGLVYQIIKDKFSVFGNYQNSFKSNGYYIVDKQSNIALSDPEKANQFEGGLKGNLFNGRINATVSYYDIKVKNMLLDTGEYLANFQSVQTQAGKLHSKGVELEVNAYLVKGFSLIGGIAYNDTRDVQTGLRPTTAGSYWLANFNASYQFLDGNLKGLGFGIGGNYASDNNVTGNFILPKYFVLNANAFYDTKKFRVGVKVDNFTNQHYWTGYTTANPQKLINALGSITYKF